MRRTINFQGMDHSIPLEEHINQRLEKLEELVKSDGREGPFYTEIHLKAHGVHPHHTVDIELKTPEFNLHTSHEGTAMYQVVDECIDTMINLVKKERGKLKDHNIKKMNDKTRFSS